MDDRDFQASRTTRLLCFLVVTWLASSLWSPQEDTGAGAHTGSSVALTTRGTAAPR